jgi:chitinase
MRTSISLFLAGIALLLAVPAVAHAQTPKPQIQVDDPWVPEKNAGTSSMAFHVRLSTAATAPVTVRVATVDGTATSPADYAAVPATTLTFAPGETEKVVPVTLVGDNQREGNETLKLQLSKPSANAILTDTAGQGTIFDAEAPRHISVSDFYVVEPDDGEETFVGFRVSLDQVPTAGDPAGVQYTLVPGTAEFGSDWDRSSLTGFVNLDDESGGSVEVLVRVIGDTQAEIDEQLTLKLSNPEGAVLSDNLAVGTIANDDDGTPGPAPRQISVSDPWVVEGNAGSSTPARFKVSLDAPAPGPVTVKVVTGGGTATGGSDYTPAASQTVTFTPGQTSRNVDVAVLGDTLHEGAETFQLKLSQPTGAILADPAGVATIVDNEGPIVAYINDDQVTEGDPGAPGSGVRFFVRLSAPPDPGTSVALTYAPQNGTATAFNPQNGQGDFATFPASQLVMTAGNSTTQNPWTWHAASMGIVGDDLVEGDEQFSVVLSKPEGVVIGDAKGIATIFNDD